MAKSRLETDLGLDFLLVGISSHVHDYRLCGFLNKGLGIQLKRDDDIEIKLKNKDRLKGFSRYTFQDESTQVQYSVLSNSGEDALLIAEQKQIDFFLLIEGVWQGIDKSLLLEKLRNIDVVLTAYELDPLQLKSIQNLMID